MFVADLLADPAQRGASDVRHEVTAVASRSADNAKNFIKETWEKAKVPCDQGKVTAYGNYEELYADEVSPACCRVQVSLGWCMLTRSLPTPLDAVQNIDVVYLGTPHSMHFKNAHDALTSGSSPSTLSATRALC